MTVPAFSLSVVLPGAPPSVAGAGVDASTGGAGVFEGLLAGLVGANPGGWSTTAGQDGEDLASDAPDVAGPLAAADPNLAQVFASLALFPSPLTQTPATNTNAPSEAPLAAGGGTSNGFNARLSIQAAMAAAPEGQLGEPSDAAPTSGSTATAEDKTTPTARQPGFMPNGLAPEKSATLSAARSPVVVAAPPPAAPSPAIAPPPTQLTAPPPVAAAVAAAPAVEVEAVVEAPPPAPSGKSGSTDGEARRAAGSTRGDRRDATARPGVTTTSPFAPKPEAVTAAPPDATSSDAEADVGAPSDLAAADLAEAPETRQPAALAEARAQAAQTTAQIAEAPARDAPATVAKLAADIVRKVEGQSTRFDLQLDPHGMGKVDVAIEIDRDGKLTAAMSFDSPQSAADLRGRAGELRLALEQAGFDIAEGGLTFDLSGQNAGFNGREASQQQDRAWTGRAFQRAQSGAEEADLSLAATPSTPSRWTRSGVDIRI